MEKYGRNLIDLILLSLAMFSAPLTMHLQLLMEVVPAEKTE